MVWRTWKGDPSSRPSRGLEITDHKDFPPIITEVSRQRLFSRIQCLLFGGVRSVHSPPSRRRTDEEPSCLAVLIPVFCSDATHGPGSDAPEISGLLWTSVPPRLGTQNQPHRGTLAPRYLRSSTPSPTRSSGPEFLGISDPRISWPPSTAAPLLLCPSGRMFPWPNDRANQSSWGPRFCRTREPWHHGASASRAISIAAPRSPSPPGPVLPRSKAPPI